MNCLKKHSANIRTNSGIALIIVMVVIVSLGILVSGFAWFMRVEMKLATNHLSDSELEWLGRSGVELARYVVGQQLNLSKPCDALNQKWAGGPGETNDVLEMVFLEENYLGNGVFDVIITDNERKMNINTADSTFIQNALEVMGVADDQRTTIAQSIADWIDTNDDPQLSGAEEDYYMGLAVPYHCKNGPLDDIAELLLIQGVTPEIYYGLARIDGRTPSFHKINEEENEENNNFLDNDYEFDGGMMDLFCTLSSGTININTVPIEVLQMFPNMTPEMAREIITYRAGLDGVEGTEDDEMISNVSQLQAVPSMDQGVVQILSTYCGVRSTVFTVEVIAEIDGQQRKFSSMLHRVSANDVRILYFQWE